MLDTIIIDDTASAGGLSLENQILNTKLPIGDTDKEAIVHSAINQAIGLHPRRRSSATTTHSPRRALLDQAHRMSGGGHQGRGQASPPPSS